MCYYITMKENQQKFGFTLAEVLVTLTVIGVVAAITINVLNNRYNDELARTQFKSAYSLLTQAIKKTVMFDFSGNIPCYYTSPGISETWGECKPFYKELAKNLNVTKTCNGNARKDHCIPKYQSNISADSNCEGFSEEHLNEKSIAYVLANGQILITYSSYTGPLFLFDINGFRGPNKGGYDLFAFDILRDEHKNLNLNTSATCRFVAPGGLTTEEMIYHSFSGE